MIYLMLVAESARAYNDCSRHLIFRMKTVSIPQVLKHSRFRKKALRGHLDDLRRNIPTIAYHCMI